MKNKFSTVLFLIVIFLFIIMRLFIIDKKIVIGNSMSDTFMTGDVLLIEKVSKEIKRYDVVIIKVDINNFPSSVIKRVIGLPNETIQIINGYLYVNNKKEEDFTKRDPMENSGIAGNKIRLGEDEYFVLGDNRNNSEDSRGRLGIILRNQIIGKPIVRVYPFNKIEILKDEKY